MYLVCKLHPIIVRDFKQSLYYSAYVFSLKGVPATWRTSNNPRPHHDVQGRSQDEQPCLCQIGIDQDNKTTATVSYIQTSIAFTQAAFS